MISFRKVLLGLAHKMLMDKPHGIVNVVSKGVGTYGEPKVVSCDLIRIVIGKYCSIATGVTLIAGGNHNMYTPTTYPFPEIDKDINE